MNNTNRKVRVAILSIISNTTLIILKIIAGIISGSVSIISEAIHSSMDLLASIIAYFSVRYSSKPADTGHPYGHGKIENISGFIEAVLIFIAALLIIQEAIKKLFNPTEIEDTSIAIVVMIFAVIVNIIVSKILYKVAKEEDSLALEADALHLKTDVYTSLGVALGLVLIKLTGIYILDPIIALLVALLIIKEAWKLSQKTFRPLLDEKLSDEEENKIYDVVSQYGDRLVDIHYLRTRKSGNTKYIDFHLTVDGDLTVRESHDLSEEIEKDLEEIIHNTNVNIHIEPSNEKDS
ncbi:MAG: cation diffusion facilitator family transporter [Vulcanibacillus sp.]